MPSSLLLAAALSCGAVLGLVIGRVLANGVLGARIAALEADRARLRVVAEAAPSVILSYRLAPDGAWSYPFATERVMDVYGVPWPNSRSSV